MHNDGVMAVIWESYKTVREVNVALKERQKSAIVDQMREVVCMIDIAYFDFVSSLECESCTFTRTGTILSSVKWKGGRSGARGLQNAGAAMRKACGTLAWGGQLLWSYFVPLKPFCYCGRREFEVFLCGCVDWGRCWVDAKNSLSSKYLRRSWGMWSCWYCWCCWNR